MTDLSGRPFGLHIGLPRTGTKTLQWQLFSQHPQIHYMGTWSEPPKHLRRFPGKRFRSTRAEDLFHRQIMSPALTDLRASRELWRELQAEADPDKAIVWSNEILSWGELPDRRIRAELIWRLFRPCRVIVALREPVDHLESVYRLLLRSEVINPPGREVRPKSIDAWFEDPEEAPYAKIFNHAETVRIYRDLFGAESVKVLLFEQLREDPRAFFAAVSEHFGVDPRVGADLYADRVDNARISDGQVRLAAWLQNRPLFWRAVNRVRPGFRAHLLYRPPRKRSSSSDALSESNATRVRELSRPSNRWFRDELGLPLERYGYLV